MNPSSPSGGAAEAAVLQTMMLLSTLTTAVTVRQAVRERQAGRDPSMQESDHVVRPYLKAVASELLEMLMRLQASLVYAQHHRDDAGAALVRRFDDLMTLHRVQRLLHTVHQRLLSLYPDVSEALLEEARELQGACSRAIEEDGSAFALGPCIERALAFVSWMRRELGRASG